MKLIFTRSTAPLSKLIRWAFNEPVSHFAVVFDNKFVIHSNLYGVNLAWLNDFTKKSTIVYSIDMPLSLEKEEEVYRSLLDNFCGEHYDYKAFLYFAYRALLFKLFKTPLPRTNPFNTRGFLCTEMYGVLPKWLVPQPITDLSITTPFILYKRIYGENNL